MPINLENHTVSLTKNGYQKLWELIRKYPRNEILDHLDEHFPTPSQYLPQALKMLGGNERSKQLPAVWDEVRGLDVDLTKALLAISIVFSHNKFIQLVRKRTRPGGAGMIERPNFDQQKEYTNFAYALDELGIATHFEPGSDQISYNWQRAFVKIG